MPMDVHEAVTTRRAVRAFTAEPVPRPVLDRVLSTAARAPSGANLQPWHICVLTGAPLAELKQRATTRAEADDPGDPRQYPMYPAELHSPYRERRSDAAAQRFDALGIRRTDSRRRAEAVTANWQCFGAPTLLLVYIDRGLGPAQWADLGMYLQTVMLLLRAEGLHSCPQMAWSVYHRTVAGIVSPPSGLILFGGLSIGYEDTSAPYARIDRAPLAETVSYVE